MINRELVSAHWSPEQKLVALLCGTRQRRAAAAAEASALLAEADEQRLLTLLKRLKLLGLLGQRLMSLPMDLTESTGQEIEAEIRMLRRAGTGMELTALSVLAELERAGIRALPLKGSTLARIIYGDPAMRTSRDVDILVAVEHLAPATDVVCRMGWQRDVHPMQGDALPLLHERLVHPRLPSVEIHWRVHWLESRFSADALARATRRTPREALRMQPRDELTSLMLFYARDGFSGLRTPADIAQWWSMESPALDNSALLDPVADGYPELAIALELSASLLAPLVGVPVLMSPRTARPLRLATKMANPFTTGPPNQIAANAGLVDVLLAPPGGRAQAVGRHLLTPSMGEYRRFAHFGLAGENLARGEHVLRVTRRWAVGAGSAVAGVYQRGGRGDRR